MKILIAGGHVTPALAFIESLPKDVQILYVGREHALEGDKAISLEYQAVTSRHIPFAKITTGRLQRYLTKQTIPSLLRIPWGFLQSLKIILTFRPTVVVGFGGYVSVPLGLAAAVCRIPLVIHEQTLRAGLANKFLARFANVICVSWEESKAYFPSQKTIVTGNPSAQEIFSFPLRPKSTHAIDHIVIVGGSLGSHVINTLVAQTLEKLVSHYTILHQTGDAKEYNDYEKLVALKKSLPYPLSRRYEVVKFIDPRDILSIFRDANLVVSRAGINTVTALLLLQKPSLLIPLPFVKNDQRTNALFLKQFGLAEVVSQESLTPERLYEQIRAMVEHRKKVQNDEQIKAIIAIHKNASKNLYNAITYAIDRKKTKT